ncbi:MAG: hypothetical protein AB1439_08655 [candidate division FCPU426 bacterium]
MPNRFPLCLLLAGCLAWSACAPHPAPQAQTDDSFPPYDLIAGNFAETDVSLDLQFTRVEVAKAPTDKDIYGEWLVTANVLQVFAGEQLQPGEAFAFYWGFERGIPMPATPGRYLGSFRRHESGRYFVPDNGYVFPYEPRLEALFEKAAAAPK